MLNYISAEKVYPIVSDPIKNGVIALEPNGQISALLSIEEAKQKGVKNIVHYKGILVPGFINTHCHLELAHLKDKISMHTGLPDFVQQVMTLRQSDDVTILKAMQKADEQMYANGIVAVGDVSNQLISKTIKLSSSILYHTFVEAMSFNPSRAKAVMQAARILKKEFLPLDASIVPHAPYSVSKELFNEIYNYASEVENLSSIHNQETDAENSFFEDKSGDFLKLYEFLGTDIANFKPSGTTSLKTFLPLLSAQRTLLVHNIVTSLEDISFAKRHHNNLYWCLCPNANLYIENKLPDVTLLMNAGLKITLGTDSLASNSKLSILDEMRALQEKQNIEFGDLLRWATLNGAEFLGIAHQFGTFEAGKRPGVNLIEFADREYLNTETRITRLF